MPNFSVFKNVFLPPDREEKPRYKTLSVTTARRGDYIELEVTENVEPDYILARNSDGETLRIGLDKMLIKAQNSYDRHFMTTVGARFTIKADTHHAYHDFYVWRLIELRYGLEVWDRGFRY